MNNLLAEEIAVTWELCGGRLLSEGATTVILKTLEAYDQRHVRAALRACVEELEHSITIGAIVSRIKRETQKPESLRDFDNSKALPAHVPQNHMAALCRVAQESMGKGWSLKEIEDRVAVVVTEMEDDWDDIGI